MWLHSKNEYHAFYEKKERECSEFFSGAINENEIRSRQQQKLNNIVSFVNESSPFYKDKLKGADLSVIIDKGVGALPYTTKEELRDAGEFAFSRPISKCDIYCETTGTTGRATAAARDIYDRIVVTLNYAHGWKTFFKPGDNHIVGLSGPSELHSMVYTFKDVFNCLGFCVANIYPFSQKINFEKSLSVMKELGISVLSCTPTVALLLAKAAEKYGFNMQRDFKLQWIFLTGEMCTEAMCANVGKIWNCCAVNNPLASQEAHGITVGSPENILYTLPLSYYYELVDPITGQNIGPRGRGELVLTMLEKGSRPLIRFKSGDLVEIKKGGAENRWNSDTLMPLGRVKDVISLYGKAVTAYELEQVIIENSPNIFGYDLEIDEGDELLIRIELQNKGGEINRNNWEGQVKEAVEGRLGVRCRVEATAEVNRATTTSPFMGWKAARIRDLRNKEIDIERSAAERIGKSRVI